VRLRPGSVWAGVAAALLVACAGPLLPLRAAEGAWTPSVARDPSGEGFVVPGTGLWFAGDVTSTFGAPEVGPAFTNIEDMSLLLRYEPHPRVAFFSEIRVQDVVEAVEGSGVDHRDALLSFERLYLDVLLTPHLTLRAGKFFTPFGLWNVIRRAPLTWTVDPPEVTEETFPLRTTGLGLVYQTTWHGWSFDATGYGPAQDKLAVHRTDESGLMGGGRMAVGRALGPVFGAFGVSGAGFQDHDTGRWAGGYGADVELTFYGHQVTGEFEYTDLQGPDVSHESGFYLQDAIPITSTLYGVLRVERFHARDGNAGNGGLVGLFWRPLPYVILKADYQVGDRLEDFLEPGFFASVALFF
jgi:hypothetical protein